MKCGECIFLNDTGHCRLQDKARSYFAEACSRFSTEPYIHKQPKEEKPMKEEKKTAAVETSRICKGCGKELPLEQFGRNRYGYTWYCVDCMKARRQQGMEKAGYNFGEAPAKPKRKAQPKDKPAADAQPEAKPAPEWKMTDAELITELRARGYRGRLEKVSTIEL